MWEEIKAIKKRDYPSISMDNQKEFYTGSTFAFDATIALAEAFHLATKKGVVDFDTYKYKNHATTFKIGQLLLGTSFEGVTVGDFDFAKSCRAPPLKVLR